MPRVIKRGHSLSFGRKHIEYLTIGGILSAGRNPFDEFADVEDAMLRAWFMFRDDIMREHATPGNSGSRPHGFWLFEVCHPPKSGAVWSRSQQLRLLLELNLMDEVEKLQVECNDIALSDGPDQTAYLTAVQLPSLPLDDCSRFGAEENLLEFETAAMWHRARGRPELAQKFAELAGRFRSVLEARESEMEITK